MRGARARARTRTRRRRRRKREPARPFSALRSWPMLLLPSSPPLFQLPPPTAGAPAPPSPCPPSSPPLPPLPSRPVRRPSPHSSPRRLSSAAARRNPGLPRVRTCQPPPRRACAGVPELEPARPPTLRWSANQPRPAPSLSPTRAWARARTGAGTVPPPPPSLLPHSSPPHKQADPSHSPLPSAGASSSRTLSQARLHCQPATPLPSDALEPCLAHSFLLGNTTEKPHPIKWTFAGSRSCATHRPCLGPGSWSWGEKRGRLPMYMHAIPCKG
ncbi:uncharacterized protein LOC127541532 [Antechinus flavipes]|uniref:uncharacterized protein LOC127541532 n=1 Tax=Antechinus flavipes TaxID=38775 RepID=UPI00223678C4|nr:uncharacterized protein LOC127541532 [Antechinus flavipes]